MLGDLARCKSARALLNEAPEYVQASFLRKSGECANGLYRFHISMIIEIMVKVKQLTQARRNSLRGLCRRNDRVHLELNDVTPLCNPFVEKFRLRCFHQLKAAFEFFINPARDVAQALRRQASAVAEALIHGHRIPVVEVLDDHVVQDDAPAAG
jgi:hypothetical protein